MVFRADGVISCQLAVVVDDALMGITDVIRGDDLLTSTPRQLLLYKALRLEAPTFGHVPMLVDGAGCRLAKRNRSLTLRAMREARVKPQAVMGVIAYFAGLQDRPDPSGVDQLISSFSLDKLPTDPIRMTPDSLKQRTWSPLFPPSLPSNPQS
ncbi:glutamate--tRNA ligase family protein [Alicyclobacillus dauci]|uniref:glutamate--tRNA ligase family protein n=1 Tax=Alicyclobacillus dauci TaxID=1475485 RepID=UPI002DD444F6|nr:glutamate--tRNA ligase family protein [Alicyclobacillus dauci]